MNATTLALLQAAPTPAAPNPLLQMLPFVAVFVIFYFLLIRPQQKARKEHEALVQGVRRGDTVVTSGGIIGKVTKAGDEDEATVEISPGVEIKVVKATLADVRSKTKPVKADAGAKADSKK